VTAVIVNLAGVILIGLVIWWFWVSTPKARAVAGAIIDVVVDGGVYDPDRIQVVAGKPVTLRFLRRDPSPCAEKVIFDQLGVAADLPVGQPVAVTLTPARTGEFSFTCQMQMYRGTLVVVDPTP